MIAVIGATGFIGSAVTAALVRSGEPVRALVRSQERAHARLGSLADRVQHVVGDMGDPAALDRLLGGARAVYVLVQTVASPQPRGTGTFVEAEREATRRIVDAAVRHGTRRLVTVGLIGASTEAHNPWVRARADLETLLLGSGLEVTVLRPGLVVGLGSAGFDALLTAARSPRPRIRGRGHQRWSFIALHDLVRYLVEALESPATYGQVLDVGSSQAPTYRELLRRTASVIGEPERRIRVTPLWALRALAPIVSLQQGLPRGGLRAAAEHLGDDLVGDPRPIRAMLPFTLATWEESVVTALAARVDTTL